MTILQQALHNLIEEYAHVIGEIAQHNPKLAVHIWSRPSAVLVRCRKILALSLDEGLLIDTLRDVHNLMPGLHDGLRDLEDVMARSPLVEPAYAPDLDKVAGDSL